MASTDNEVDKKMMKGGEMIVWGDTVDATNLLSLTWYNFKQNLQRKKRKLIIKARQKKLIQFKFLFSNDFSTQRRPKASAMAERLWTNPTGPTSRVRVLDRLQEQRCRLLLRGIPAAPITPGYCGSFEWDMQ